MLNYSPFGQRVTVLLRVQASASANVSGCGSVVLWKYLPMWGNYCIHLPVFSPLLGSRDTLLQEEKMLAKSRQSPLCVEFQAMLRDRIKQNLRSVQCTEWIDCHYMGLQTTIILMGGNIVYKVWIYYIYIWYEHIKTT